MAIQTRYAGDALPTINVDAGLSNPAATTATVIAPGLTKVPFAFKVAATNLGAAAEMATGGAVETVLRSIAQDSTIVMYQVDSGQISVLVEATGAGGANGDTYQGAAPVTTSSIVTALATRLQALGGAGNIGLAANVWAPSITVTSNGFKL
jgi:hypothetical protein